MTFRSKTGIFPWFTILLGMIGFALRCVLFAGTAAGLVPEHTVAGALCFVLFAVALAFCALGLRNTGARAAYAELFPASQAAGIGSTVAAVGFLISAFTLKGAGMLGTISAIIAVPAAFALAAAGYCRYVGRRPKFALHCAIALFLMLRTMAFCQIWRSESQLQLYFFQLLACLFLMLACYYRTALDLQTGDCRKFIFFAQAALFCCCLSCRGDNWLFYLAGAFWMASDFCTLPASGRFGR